MSGKPLPLSCRSLLCAADYLACCVCVSHSPDIFNQWREGLRKDRDGELAATREQGWNAGPDHKLAHGMCVFH